MPGSASFLFGVAGQEILNEKLSYKFHNLAKCAHTQCTEQQEHNSGSLLVFKLHSLFL